MKKKTLLLVMCLIINLLVNTVVFAENSVMSDEVNEPSLVSVNALDYTNAEFAPESIVKYLDNNNIYVDEKSIIEVLPITKNCGKTTISTYNTILSVTNIVDHKVYKDFLITFSKEDDGSISICDVPSVFQPNAGTTIEFPPKSWDDRLTIRGTAVYDLYSDGFWTYYRPYGCYFTYTKKDSSVNVQYISVEYICDGFVYTYPGFSPLNYEVEHVVGVYKSYPSTNTMYSKTNYFDSDKVIDVTSGSPFVGNFITFEFTIDGSTDGYTVKF